MQDSEKENYFNENYVIFLKNNKYYNEKENKTNKEDMHKEFFKKADKFMNHENIKENRKKLFSIKRPDRIAEKMISEFEKEIS